MRIDDIYELLDTKHGRVLCNRNTVGFYDSLVENGDWSWVEVEFTSRFATGVVVDVGAFIGTSTLSYARTAQQVYSFEPQPLSYYTLCANLLLNNVLNVNAVQCALGAENGYIPMSVLDPTEKNGMASVVLGEGNFKASIRTLDSLNLPPISFIKIDVEEMEYEVLKGAVETLKRDKPVIFIECHSEDLADSVCGFLCGTLGYDIANTIERDYQGKFSLPSYLFKAKP